MSDVRTIPLPYGKQERWVHIPESQLAWVLTLGQAPALPDLPAAVRAALRAPIGSPPLKDMVRGRGQNVVVVVDDNTRITPQRLLLPILLDELNAAGVPDGNITVLIALGTHRHMSLDECRAHYGDEVMGRVRVENLDNANPAAFVDLGTTKSGIPVQVARRYYEASFKIAVGNIIPHMYTGWAGGAKLIQPGVCSHVTTGRTHVLAAPLVYQNLGNLDNPVRREIDEIGIKSGLSFIVNTVLNSQHQVVQVVAGHSIAAHRQGVQTAQGIFGVRVPEIVDVVVASSTPADRDLWQGFKPLNAAGMTVRAGGEVILLLPAPEGIAPDHPAVLDFPPATNAEMLARLGRGEVHDDVAAAAYIAGNVTSERARVTLVSDGITAEEAHKMHLGLERDVDRAVDAALRRAGPTARVGVLPHAADMAPIL